MLIIELFTKLKFSIWQILRLYGYVQILKELLLLVVFILFLLPEKWVAHNYDWYGDAFPYLLNYAFKSGYIFGKDIIYTYGPLSFLSTGLTISGGVWAIITFKIFFLGFYFWVLRTFFFELSYLIFQFFFLIFLIYFGRIYLGDITLYSFLLFAYFLNRYEKLTWLNLWGISFITGIFFFIKLHVALAFLLISCMAIFLWIYKEKNRPVIHYLLVLMPIIFILVFSIYLPVHLIEYIKSFFLIIKGTNDAMFLEVFSSYSLYATLCIILLLFLPLVKLRYKYNIEGFYRLFVFSLAVFISFKQGYTRADEHQLLFLGAIPLMILQSFQLSSISAPVKGVLATVCIFLAFFSAKSSHILLSPRFSYSNIQSVHEKSYSLIPAKIRKIISDSTVDIIPGRISMAFTDSLNYKPRPVPQSYIAFNRNLDETNAEFFKGQKSPEFVLYNNGSIDDRHPFWDESYTKLVLLENYTLVSFFEGKKIKNVIPKDSFLLLKKNEYKLSINEKLVLDTVVRLDDTIMIPFSKNLLRMHAEVHYTLPNKIRNTLFHSRAAYIKLFYDDYSSSRHRVIPKILEEGVFLNYKILSSTEAFSFFSNSLDELPRTTKFVIEGNKLWVKDLIRLKFYEISVK